MQTAKPNLLPPSFWHTLLASALILGSLAACQRRCQPAAEQAFQNLSATEWRFVESSNPGFRELNNYNFLIMKFNDDFTGEVFTVRENRRLQTAQKVFEWNVDTNRESLTAAYSTPPVEGQEGATQSTSQPTIVNYSYDLGRELKLREAGTGYTYRLVPFTGVVAPDNVCTF